MKVLFLGAIILTLFSPYRLDAQEVHQDVQETVPATVLRILEEDERLVTGTDLTRTVQTVQVEIMGGAKSGEVATFQSDITPLKEGDHIFVNRLVSIDGIEYFEFKDMDRRSVLIALGLGFALLLIILSGMHGVRALASLGVSVAVILFVLVPLLLRGYPPAPVCVLVATAMLACALFLTHGVTRQSVIAFTGTAFTIVVTSVLAGVVSTAAGLTGLSSDEAIFLNFSTKGTLDFGALLLGSIIIGIIGILDDIAVTQAAVVEELKYANDDFSFHELFKRALRVGRDHMSSLVNTLSFAYVGAALPLILLMVQAGSSVMLSLNQEVVAVELIRIMVGSIGLILTVPVTTALAALWYTKYGVDEAKREVHHGGHIH